MFKLTALKQCLVLLLALVVMACSSTDPRTNSTNRSVLPISPIPQVRIQAPRNVYIPQVFDEYRPQQPAAANNSQGGYADDVLQKDYRDVYTTPLEREPTVVVEVFKPEPIQEESVNAETLVTKVDVEDFSKNELDIDPFADVPDREVISMKTKDAAAPPLPRSTQPMSRAAKALLLAAKAESAVGRNDAAINKVERALRIEPQSPNLWYQLANFNFKKGRYGQAISLARKALPMASGNRGLVDQNLDLMSKAAVKTGNTAVFKEVLDYQKQNF